MGSLEVLRAMFGERKPAITKRIITDFDGIYNPLGYDERLVPWDDMEYGTFTDNDGDVINVFTSPTVLGFMREVAARPDVEVILLSTWCNHIHEETFMSFGFPRVDIMRGNELGIYYDTKLMNIVLQPDGVDTLWLEDELTEADRAKLESFNAAREFPIDVITPRTYKGLTPDDLQTIKDFLER